MGPRNPRSPVPLGAPGVDICRGSQRRGPAGGDRDGERNEEAKLSGRWYTWGQKRTKPVSNRRDGEEKRTWATYTPNTPRHRSSRVPKMSQHPVATSGRPFMPRCAHLTRSLTRPIALASAASNRLICMRIRIHSHCAMISRRTCLGRDVSKVRGNCSVCPEVDGPVWKRPCQ